MPKFPAWYDPNNLHNSRLIDAMAELRRMCCYSEHINPHAKKPGSHEAIEAIKSSIDFWAEREMGNKDFFWGKPSSVG